MTQTEALKQLSTEIAARRKHTELRVVDGGWVLKRINELMAEVKNA